MEGREHGSAEKLEQFKSTFNAEISQFISSVRVMERTKADATRMLERVAPQLLDKQFRGNNFLEDVEKKEYDVTNFFFSDDYSDMLSSVPGVVCEQEYDELLIGLSKAFYSSARDVLLNEIKSLLETLFCYKREMVERPDDDKELVRLNQIGNAYGMLMAYVSSDRKKQLHREIEKKALEKIDNSPKHKQILTKCIEDGQKTKERLKKFKEGLSHTTLKMVSVSPPMVLHIDKNESNSLLLEEPVTPPLHWIRPIIMKSYLGTPLVKGLAKDKDNDLKGFVMLKS